MPVMSFEIRPARDGDRIPLALIFAGIAEELDWIATEPPVDVEARAAAWTIEAIVVAVAAEEIAGFLSLEPSRHGYGDVALAVDARVPRLWDRHRPPRGSDRHSPGRRACTS